MTLADEFAKILDDEDPWERKDSIDKWEEEGKIDRYHMTIPLYLTVGQFDSEATYYDGDADIDWGEYQVPDELWDVIEKYAGLEGEDYYQDSNDTRRYSYLSPGTYNWEGMQTNDDRIPRLIDVPIDLAIKVCDECGSEEGGDILRRRKEKYGSTTEGRQVWSYWDLDNIYSDIQFSDGSFLEGYDWSFD